MEWRRADGSHFDPWLRIHERVGGEIIAPAPESMVIEAPVADWEEWTGMRVPGRRRPHRARACSRRSSSATAIGRHVEPNVWVVHRI